MLKKISAFLRGVKGEMKRVSWPSRPRIIRSTLVVLVTIVIFAALIGIIDIMFFQIIKLFLK